MRRINNRQKVAGKSKKPLLNPFKFASIPSSMRIPNYGTIFENRTNEGTIKNLEVGIEPKPDRWTNVSMEKHVLLLLLLTDATPYMAKFVKSLKPFYSKNGTRNLNKT